LREGFRWWKMSATERRFLIFALAERLFAFDLAQVAEVAEPRKTWPIPGAPDCYAGAINFHGSIVAVMDLAGFMDFHPRQLPEKLIVLSPEIASLAFLVDRILRIVPESQVEKRTEADGERFAQGFLLLPEGRAALLDADAIADQATREING